MGTGGGNEWVHKSGTGSVLLLQLKRNLGKISALDFLETWQGVLDTARYLTVLSENIIETFGDRVVKPEVSHVERKLGTVHDYSTAVAVKKGERRRWVMYQEDFSRLYQAILNIQGRFQW